MVKNKYKIERKYIENKLARSKQKNNVNFLVSHETANNTASADNHYTYFQGIKISASAHTFIDDKKILEIIPLDEKAWHIMYQQDKKVLGLGAANDNAVGTELCRPGNFGQAYDRYVWYHAYLCKKFGLQPKKHIVSHKVLDPQRRPDPQSWLEPNGITWSQFLNDVQNYYDKWEGKVAENPVINKPVEKPKKPTSNAYTGNSIVSYLNSIKVDSSYTNRAKLASKHGIKNYRGTAAQNLNLLIKLRNSKPASKPKGDLKTGSIVDYLNSIKVDSSFPNRAKLAAKHGIKNYKGTANQNMQLLNKMRK